MITNFMGKQRINLNVKAGPSNDSVSLDLGCVVHD